jgi:hypothetical protein
VAEGARRLGCTASRTTRAPARSSTGRTSTGRPGSASSRRASRNTRP